MHNWVTFFASTPCSSAYAHCFRCCSCVIQYFFKLNQQLAVLFFTGLHSIPVHTAAMLIAHTCRLLFVIDCAFFVSMFTLQALKLCLLASGHSHMLAYLLIMLQSLCQQQHKASASRESKAYA
eukprot:6948-Heterococcus_DN1.PRE.5